MRFGILGTGDVGLTIATKLVQNGYEVKVGSRTAENKKGMEWAASSVGVASYGSFSDAAAFGEMIFNCTPGMHSMEALEQAGQSNLKGKIIVDIANPLDFSKGMPPTLSVCNTDSLGEQIQRGFPDSKVVKTLNTMSHTIMVNPKLVPGKHTIFMSGNDNEAKQKVSALLKEEFGWDSIIDLGDIKTARGTEMMLPLWLSLYGKLQSRDFNFSVVTK